MKQLLLLLLIIGCSLDVADNKDGGESNDGGDCSTYFAWNQSSLQAAYFFTNVTIAGELIDTLDWVGAFNGDICVNAKQWNTNQCLSDICDIIPQGNNEFDETIGYCNPGDIPTFKIYDVSAGIIYNTTTTDDIPPWQNGSLVLPIDTLKASTIFVSNCQTSSSHRY